MASGFLRVRGKQVNAHLFTIVQILIEPTQFIGALMNVRTDWKEEVLKAVERNSQEERRQKVVKIADEEDQI
ncbi:hypothetical protein C0995_008669 [Termitomyces sp. Mi166|nr:hypothetical protein C0995_008669 [Termitomyces sp. Mi166\